MYSSKKFYISFLFLLNSTFINAQTTMVQGYIDLYKNIAMREMMEYKVPASITLAQGLLESGSGNSRLAMTGNNHFGIKCKKDWTGCTILEDDDALQECFRCYSNAEESFKDHSRFLSQNKRYAGLFILEITDYKGWAKGLLAAGYASNKKYTDLLISCIERNKLAYFDTLVMKGYNPYDQQMPANITVVNSKNIPTTVVQPDQSLEIIALKNGKTESKLSKYNDLEHHHIAPGDVLYLKPKKRKSGISSHVVLEGEDMWQISQKYAIKLNSLYKKNRMTEGTEALPGSVLQLQHKAIIRPDTGRVSKTALLPTIVDNNQQFGNPNTYANEGYHIVVAGETLYSISKLYNISIEELKSSNHLENNQLNIGQKLLVKDAKPATIPIKNHIVKTGDTLYSIAKLYNMSIEDLKKTNSLSSDTLTIGQILTIK